MVSPLSTCAKIGSSKARAPLGEPVSRRSRARSIAARSSRMRASWLRAVSMAFRKHASARARSGSGRLSAMSPSTRCKSASQNRSPRLLDKGESFLERCAGACRIARREGSLGKARQDQRVHQ